jgi:uncharacterized protein YeaO (DUF488 family)
MASTNKLKAKKLDAIKIARIYDVENQRTFKILVDRSWPRGVRKDKISLWMKDIAPSNELRNWYSHDESRWLEFKKKYTTELRNHKGLIDKLVNLSRKRKIILVYASKSPKNNAVVLKSVLARAISRKPSTNKSR